MEENTRLQNVAEIKTALKNDLAVSFDNITINL